MPKAKPKGGKHKITPKGVATTKHKGAISVSLMDYTKLMEMRESLRENGLRALEPELVEVIKREIGTCRMSLGYTASLGAVVTRYYLEKGQTGKQDD